MYLEFEEPPIVSKQKSIKNGIIYFTFNFNAAAFDQVLSFMTKIMWLRCRLQIGTCMGSQSAIVRKVGLLFFIVSDWHYHADNYKNHSYNAWKWTQGFIPRQIAIIDNSQLCNDEDYSKNNHPNSNFLFHICQYFIGKFYRILCQQFNDQQQWNPYESRFSAGFLSSR